jgi:membrane associated rhomboid family serine protease
MNFAASPMATVIFLATIGLSLYTLFKNQNLLYQFMLHPYSLVREKKYYQVITSGFIHADLGHLMFNMLAFLFFAFRLEIYIGTISFFVVYFGSMIIADITSIAKNKNRYEYRSLGASGAISGVLFSYILFDPTAKIGVLLLPIGIPAPIFAVLYLVYCHFSARRQGDNINHNAHFWGALGGLILTGILKPGIFIHFFRMVF